MLTFWQSAATLQLGKVLLLSQAIGYIPLACGADPRPAVSYKYYISYFP
jgi:hypothetical protein